MPKQKRSDPLPATRIVTTGSTIRIEPARGRNQRKPRVSVINASDEIVGDFIGFLREHAIVGLAVGFVIGTQVQTVVKQLVASFIDPAFKLLFGENLEAKTFTVSFHGRHVPFGWGAFVYGLLDFLFVLIAIYAIIEIFNLDQLDKPKK